MSRIWRFCNVLSGCVVITLYITEWNINFLISCSSGDFHVSFLPKTKSGTITIDHWNLGITNRIWSGRQNRLREGEWTPFEVYCCYLPGILTAHCLKVVPTRWLKIARPCWEKIAERIVYDNEPNPVRSCEEVKSGTLTLTVDAYDAPSAFQVRVE